MEALKHLFATVLSLLYPDGDSATYEEAAHQLVAFETKLAKACLINIRTCTCVPVIIIMKHNCANSQHVALTS